MDDDLKQNDAETCRRVLSGDRNAFREIVLRYQKKMLRTASSFLGDAEQAHDAVQEIFIKVFHSLHKFDTNRPFAPWLYSIAMNTLRTSYGRRRRIEFREGIEYDEPAGAAPEAESQNPIDEVIREEQRREVSAAIATLPPTLREVVVLYYIEQLSVSETSEALGITTENVKSRLFRARKILKGKLLPDATDGAVW